MSIIKFAVKTVSGSLESVQSSEEISVGKDAKAKVVLAGYIGGPREKGEDGKYHSTVYGRLPVKGAIAGTGDNQRYVLDIAGGLRGVLFKAREKKTDKSPDYTGNIELDRETVMPLFGRIVKTQDGEFISLSSMEAEPKKQSGSQQSQQAPAQRQAPRQAPQPAPDFEDDDIPF